MKYELKREYVNGYYVEEVEHYELPTSARLWRWLNDWAEEGEKPVNAEIRDENGKVLVDVIDYVNDFVIPTMTKHGANIEVDEDGFKTVWFEEDGKENAVYSF